MYTDRVINSITDKENLITLHNHPASMPPSPDDFSVFESMTKEERHAEIARLEAEARKERDRVDNEKKLAVV